MSKFSNIDITVNGVDQTYLPYDRGAQGAFVYRKQGESIYAARVIVNTVANDSASDKMTVQLNQPRTCPSADCETETLMGTDLVKTELRFLATTSKQDRVQQIDAQVALLQELRHIVEGRGVIYA